ncbi:FAD:protein FMN transferase [Pedobacter sp. SAFR-022]|uniref:FAD:protein FMN transferase n=1 Tax=Pedobacter sp. SAFR-022 TaxID=3436861 RepID=UPI003F7F6D1F
MLIYRSTIICLLLLFPFLFKSGEQQLYTITGFAQGTGYSLRYYADTERVSKAQVDSLLRQIDASMSLYKPGSLINQFNSAGRQLRVDDGFRTVLQKSFEIYHKTAGRFDITVAPLVQLWGFGPVAVQGFPDSSEVRETLKQVGMSKLKLKGNMLYKADPKIRIDLNGIAQGYSVDQVAGFLKRRGIQSYMVEIGGEVVVHGSKPDGGGYRIGIEGPVPEHASLKAKEGAASFRHIVELKQGAITTSGNFNKYLNYKDGKISHLINPKTGYPLNNGMISVTVYARDAITADGYDNALMAMDVEQAMAFARKADLEAYFIYHKPDGRVADTLTSGFKKLLVN